MILALILEPGPFDSAYGFQRALDYAGAVGGSLMAAAALTWWDSNLSHVIVLSFVPAMVAWLMLALLLRERKRPVVSAERSPVPPLRWSALSPAMRRFLPVLAVFSLSRASEAFILLRGHELGMSAVALLLLWAALCAVQSGVALLGGGLSDRFSRRGVAALSWAMYGASFLFFAAVGSVGGLWAAVVVYALLSGMSEGAERAFVSDLSTAIDRGTAFGWYNMVVGLAAVPAGALFGVVWHYYGAAAAFAMAGALGLAASVALRLLPQPYAAAKI